MLLHCVDFMFMLILNKMVKSFPMVNRELVLSHGLQELLPHLYHG